jgi:CHAT domain-containing protein
VQFYRYLDQGLPKAEALHATRRAMQTGSIRLQDDQILGVDGTPLISELTELQQSRIAYGMRHPFFWSGIELIGTPW